MAPLGDQFARRRRDVLETDIGRVADDGVELLAFRVGKEIERQGPRRTVIGIQLQPHRTGQVAQEGPVAAGGLEHAAAVAAQGQHRAHHRLRGEDLAERGDVAQAEPELLRHGALLGREPPGGAGIKAG